VSANVRVIIRAWRRCRRNYSCQGGQITTMRSRAMQAPIGLRSIAARLGSGCDNRRANAICL